MVLTCRSTFFLFTIPFPKHSVFKSLDGLVGLGQFETLGCEQAVLFIGFDSPVPPRICPLANLSANLAVSAELSEFAAYQTRVFWHHAMKAVAPQTSPSAEID